MKENRLTGKYILLYTALFLFLCALVFLPFALSGKCLVGQGDGESQYILQLSYMGSWLREAVSGYFHGDFTPARFDFAIGMGDDINSVVRFHPLDFLSVFVPEEKTELLYQLILFLRLYLAGLSFSLYVFFFRKRERRSSFGSWGVLSGAIIYLFTGYTFSLGIVHPTYLSPLITLPLLLLGAERMIERRGKFPFLLFSLMTALSFISNYYFMYIASVALFFYVCIRFFQTVQEKRITNFFLLFVRMGSAYLLGVCLSGWALIPQLSRYSQSYRASRISEVQNLLFYADKRRYLAWLINLISPLRASGNGTHLNYAVLVFPALVLLYLGGRASAVEKAWKGERAEDQINVLDQAGAVERAKERIFLRISGILLLAFLLIPAGGFLLAALNNENNRWVFLIALYLGGVVSFSFEDFFFPEKREKRILLFSAFLFDLAVLAALFLGGGDFYNIAGAVELTLAVLLILWVSRNRGEAHFGGLSIRAAGEEGKASDPAGERWGDESRTEMGQARQMTVCLLSIVLLSTVLNGLLTFGAHFGNLPRYYMDAGTTRSYYTDAPYRLYRKAALLEGEEKPWEDPQGTQALPSYRVDGVFGSNLEDNASLLFRYPGIQIYNSVLNASEIEMLLDTENIGLTTMLHVHGLDGRPVLSLLSGVRTFLVDSYNEASIPFGYEKTPLLTEGEFSVYRYQGKSGLTFRPECYMRQSDYRKLNAVEREMALLQAAVLQDRDMEALLDREGLSSEKIRSAEDFRKSSGIITVEAELPEGNSKIEGSEGAYLVRNLKGKLKIPFERKAGYACFVSFEGLVPGKAGRMKLAAEGILKQITLLTKSETYTLGRENYTVYLGSDEKDLSDRLLLSFTEKGRISLGRVRFFYVPMEGFEEKAEDLFGNTGSDFLREGDEIRGTVRRPMAGILVFSIPYSSGWSIQLDGEERAPLKVDGGFLGVYLPEGEHSISLIYQTPGLLLGERMTVVGLMLLPLLMGFQLWRRRKMEMGDARLG